MTKESKLLKHIIESVGSVIHGKDEQIKICLATWLSGGHVLLEDVPGTRKTLLAKSLAKNNTSRFSSCSVYARSLTFRSGGNNFL